MSEFYNACKDKDIIVFHPKALGAVDIPEKLKILYISMPSIPIIYSITGFSVKGKQFCITVGYALNPLHESDSEAEFVARFL